MIRALIFDFDGTILDTEEPEFRTWQEIYGEHNATLPIERYALVIGSSTDVFDIYGYLEQQVGHEIPREELTQRRRARNREIILTKAIFPGVESYITQAKQLGLKLGVASSSSRAWVTGHLSRLGLLDSFDFLRCGDEVKRKKPDPELYLDVLNHFGITAHEAIVLEDSPNGVRAAQAAGIFCVAVPNAITGQLSLDHADLRLSSLADLPLEKLIALVEDRTKAISEL